jgi:hypothetical protein
LPKILAGIDKATQATNAGELAAALNQVADTLEFLKTRFTSSSELKAITQGNEETWPKNCVAISRRAQILVAEVEAAGKKLENYFDKYTTDPAVAAASERIRKALQED